MSFKSQTTLPEPAAVALRAGMAGCAGVPAGVPPAARPPTARPAAPAAPRPAPKGRPEGPRARRGGGGGAKPFPADQAASAWTCAGIR